MATIRDFEKHVGRKSMSSIKGQQVQEWYDGLAKAGFAPNTMNLRLSTIKSIFKHAVDMGKMREAANPAAAVITLKSEGVVDRKDFPDSIFATVCTFLAGSKLVDAQDWIMAMMISRYAGLRLRDAVRVEQKNFDAEKNILCYAALKTGRDVCIPIFEPLATLLGGKKNGDQFYCPKLHGHRASALSMRFADVLVAAGVENEKTAIASGRQYSKYSFHGLRHAFVTDLAKRGVPEHLRMILSDHSTKKAHAGYNHSQASDLAEQVSKFFNDQA